MDSTRLASRVDHRFLIGRIGRDGGGARAHANQPPDSDESHQMEPSCGFTIRWGGRLGGGLKGGLRGGLGGGVGGRG